jgi:hypothetical protein
MDVEDLTGVPATIDIGPADLGEVPLYVGTPFDLSIANDGESYEGKSFVAQIRAHRRDEEILLTFDISTSIITGEEGVTDGTLEIHLHLDGDSAVGALDAPSRLIERTAYFDIDVIDEFGAVEDTIAQGRLVPTQDVTR